MDYRILGPLEVSENGREIEVAGQKLRALLAVLLIHANEVVSQDRLIDDLWGELPPTGAAKTLQVHVSRLRRTLSGGEAVLETGTRGYVLKVEPGAIDADRFAAQLDEGRGERAAGRPERAAELLRQALALWRGPALADLAYEPFAQEEIARLEELRLTALEERIEADLELGRDAELVGELETLAARHPFRERVRAQLMLALYRADRQAEALNAYQQGRLALAEIGLEPSQNLRRLERRILEQDPALALPVRAAELRPRPSRRLALVVAASAALLVATGAAVLLPRVDGTGGAAATAGGHAVALDARSGESLATVALGTAPAGIAVGAGGVWVVDAQDRTVTRIDPAKHTPRTFGTASTPTDVAAGPGGAWIGNGFSKVATALPESVKRLDPESAALGDPVALPGVRRVAATRASQDSLLPHIAVTRDAVWVVNPDLSVSRIDPRTNDVVARVGGVHALSIAAGDAGVWVVDDRSRVVEIDPATSTVAKRIAIAAPSLAAPAVGARAVWVTDPAGGSVWRVDPGPKPLLRSIPLAVGVNGIAYGAGAVWTTNEIAGAVDRIDPRTNRTRAVGRMASPRGIAVAGQTVWVTAAPAPADDASLPASACRAVVFGGAGSPDRLLVSDLPLQGPRGADTAPMVEAIRFVLERHRFKAGRFTVGYQACDDSTAQASDYDPFTCFANANAYAGKLDVVGVIGAYNSGCSYVQIPVANQAPGGPLAMISPANTSTGLTRPYMGMRPGELEARYPRGERNYVRIAAADHLQSVAAAELTRELGRRALFLLSPDGDRYFTADVETAAGSLGLRIAGSAAWDTESDAFERLADRVRRSGADAVFISGFVDPNGGALVRALRARLGRDVALIATDWFAPVSDVRARAGSAADGMYLTVYGLPNSELPPPGKRFLAAFEAARARGSRTPNTAVQAAQAAEIMLAAIAHSDGSRASVTRALRRTRITDGLLGDIAFDEYGDLVAGPFTVFRVTGARSGAAVPSGFSGAVVDRTIVARADRLR